MTVPEKLFSKGVDRAHVAEDGVDAVSGSSDVVDVIELDDVVVRQ